MAERIQQLKPTAANEAEALRPSILISSTPASCSKACPGSCPVLRPKTPAVRIIADGAFTLPLARFLCHFLMGFGHFTKGLGHLAVGFRQ